MSTSPQASTFSELCADDLSREPRPNQVPRVHSLNLQNLDLISYTNGRKAFSPSTTSNQICHMILESFDDGPGTKVRALQDPNSVQIAVAGLTRSFPVLQNNWRDQNTARAS